jgi:hypothetical protein
MEVAFTGVTTNKHTCAGTQLKDTIVARLHMRSAQWRQHAVESRTKVSVEKETIIRGAYQTAAELYDGIANGIDCDIEWVEKL